MEIKILMVDDEPVNIELLEALLEPEGYALTKAKNGKEALERLKTCEPDLILLDVMMPGMSGYTVLEEIRKNEKTKTVPVILLTALGDREHRIRGIQAGADDYISKPFDKTELVSRVKTQAGLSILRRQINEKDKLISIIEMVADGTAVTDSMFNIQHINAKAAAMLGITGQTGNLADFFMDKYGYSFKNNPDSGSFVTKIPETDTSMLSYLSTQFNRAAETPGNAGSIVFVFRDVSEEYGRNKMKKDFLSLISDKLRSPLAIMSGYSRLIASQPPHEQMEELTKTVVRNSALVENLINRIIFFTEIDNTSIDFAANALDIKQVADRFELIYKKKYELITGYQAGTVKKWQKITAEELIENAFKFGNKQKLVLKVTIDTENMIVEDNGPGIAEQERKLVFEPFYRIENSFTGDTTGCGLGLSIVKRLAESGNRAVSLGASSSGGLKVSIGRKKPA